MREDFKARIKNSETIDKDTITKNYLRNTDHFADAVNGYFFSGEQVVKPEKLCELDPTEIKVNKKGKQKHRDLLKEAIIMEDGRSIYAIIGIEAQSNVHYAMPVRNMVYDAMRYDAQLQEIRQRHDKCKDLQADEYLSNFAKTDKLKPIFTLTIYFGAKPWDAPRSLKEMVDYPEALKPYLNDYHLNLLAPLEIEDFNIFQTEFGKVMELISSYKSKESMYNKFDRSKYNDMSDETNDFITALTDGEIQVKKEGEKRIMFPAFEEVRRDYISIGEAKGLVRGVENSSKTLNVTIKKACDIYGCTLQEYEDAKALLAKEHD